MSYSKQVKRVKFNLNVNNYVDDNGVEHGKYVSGTTLYAVMNDEAQIVDEDREKFPDLKGKTEDGQYWVSAWVNTEYGFLSCTLTPRDNNPIPKPTPKPQSKPQPKMKR